METLEDHPVFNPAIKISYQQNERKKPPVVTEGESALNFNLFEKSAAAPEEENRRVSFWLNFPFLYLKFPDAGISWQLRKC